jgi:hypothetical protein
MSSPKRYLWTIAAVLQPRKVLPRDWNWKHVSPALE